MYNLKYVQHRHIYLLFFCNLHLLDPMLVLRDYLDPPGGGILSWVPVHLVDLPIIDNVEFILHI